MATKTEHPYIVRVQDICGGKPSIRGTRIAVWLITGWFKQGYTPEAIQKMYPHLTLAQIYDALSYYHDHQEEIEQQIRDNNPSAEELAKLQAEWQRLSPI